MRQINWDDLPCLEPANLTGGKKTALTIGVFDGLHRGHKALIEKISEKAPGFLPTVVTFRGNPKKRLGESAINDIISFDEKTALLDSMGVSLCVIIDFSEHFSTITGRVFLETLHKHLCPAYIAVGANFHCGYRRDTDTETFKTLAEGLGVEVEIVPPVFEGGALVSSSRIRSALTAGKIDEAILLLGRPLKPVP